MTAETLSRQMHCLFSSFYALQHPQKHDKRESGFFKEEFRCTEKLCLCSKTYNKSDKFKFSSNGSNKRVLEDSRDGHMPNYRRVIDEAVNLASTNREVRTVNHTVSPHMSKQRKVLVVFIQEFKFKMMEFMQNH